MNAFYIICGLGIVSLLAEIANLKKYLVIFLAIGVAVAGYTLESDLMLLLDDQPAVHFFNDMLVFDKPAVIFSIVICIVGAFWFWMARDYFHVETHITDQASLVLFAVSGAVLLTSFNNMAMLFLGIEILSISLYVLAGSKKDSLFSTEAAFKYFLMGSFASGFLLMGIALVYGATGSFNIEGIHDAVATHGAELPGFFFAGVLMILVGIAFKVSAVPFHFWAPDVYEGSPTAITAFMSTIVKIGAFAAFLRLFIVGFGGVSTVWLMPLQVIVVLTLVVANVTAVFQQNVKRMLAYSSVGHAGYVLLAFATNPLASDRAIFFYLAVYAVASLAAFTVIIQMENSGAGVRLENFNGLFKKNPFLAVAMTIALLSLAGIPPLAGFFGKYLVFTLALVGGHTALVLLAVATSLIGVYYYFSVIIAMFFREPDSNSVAVGLSHKVLLFILMAISIGLGILPDLISF